ncbi:hypothetical protein AI20_12735 [Aeromonas hydrophila YL17]|nr:hypothetical protein AI20_12735 [Aeromonas hydrophila YL17]
MPSFLLLRYHDPAGWPVIREARLEMGKGHLIGNSPHCLVPPEGRNERAASGKRMKPALTRHSTIAHQRGNGAGNKAAGSQSNGRGNSAAPATNKSGNGKPLSAQLQKGSGNGKPVSKGIGQGAGQRPANLPLKVASPPLKAMAPSDRRGEFADWKVITRSVQISS